MNSEFIVQLKDMGCDIDSAQDRFMNDEEFYRKCYKMAMNDQDFELLGEALKQEDPKRAFECAHTLKGILANVAITPLYDLVVEIVEPLREGHMEDLMPVYEQLMKEYEEFREILH